MISSLTTVAATLLAAATATVMSLPAAAVVHERGGAVLAVEDPSSPSPTAPPVPDGWVTHSFGDVTLATPPTWAPVVLRGNQLRTDAALTEELRDIYQQSLKQPNVVGALVDTETLGNSITEKFVTEMIVAAQRADSAVDDAEQLAKFAQEEIYAGRDAPRDVAVTVFAHPTAPAIRARYTYDERGSRGVTVEYMIAFPTHLVFLGLSTDERNPGPDIATGEKIVRTAGIT